ncbi:MAG: endonuclease/exonuclease/phosphatase family protein [Planctomycetota bacterium]
MTPPGPHANPTRFARLRTAAAACCLAGLILPGLSLQTGCTSKPEVAPPPASGAYRIATFNTALSRSDPDALRSALSMGDDPQAAAIAEVIQRVRPDVLLLQEFDHDPSGQSLDRFVQLYLRKAQAKGLEPIDYPYTFVPYVNTGQPSGVDLDQDGSTTGPGDAYGWGAFEGQYGMVLLSRLPIDAQGIRTFRNLRWTQMPEAGPPSDAYPQQAVDRLRLSSKTHADVPLLIGDRVLHILMSHPTPPVFDGPEDRNGVRNRDEIRLWAEYLTRAPDRLTREWMVDDAGVPGRLPQDALFVILGDLNADPFDGESLPDSIARLLNHPRVNHSRIPESEGAVQAAEAQLGANASHQGPASQDTADWNDTPGQGSGNLRVDYVLPSRGLLPTGAGVFWPEPGGKLQHLLDASDHRLVWLDVQAPAVSVVDLGRPPTPQIAPSAIRNVGWSPDNSDSLRRYDAGWNPLYDRNADADTP